MFSSFSLYFLSKLDQIVYLMSFSLWTLGLTGLILTFFLICWHLYELSLYSEQSQQIIFRKNNGWFEKLHNYQKWVKKSLVKVVICFFILNICYTFMPSTKQAIHSIIFPQMLENTTDVKEKMRILEYLQAKQ